MDKNRNLIWATRLDTFCAVTGGLLPLGLVIGNTAFELIIALVGTLWIVRSVLAKHNPVEQMIRHPLILPWLAWFASVILSLLVNGPGSKGWEHDVVLIRYFLYVAALIDISERRTVFRYLLIGMAAGVLWGLINTLMAYLIGYDLFGRPLARYSFKLKDAGRIASLAGYAGPFLLGWGILARHMPVKRRAAVIAIGAVAMLQTFHIHVRTVEAGAVAGILAWMLYALKRYAGLVYAVLLAGLICVSIWGFAVFGPRVDLSSTYDRIGYWKVTWAMWHNHPVVGVSVSAWQDAYRETAASDQVKAYISPDGRSWKLAEVTHAHSLFFHIISSTGVLGLASFCWLFVNCIRLVIRKIDLCGHAMLTWPVVFLAIGLTGWNIYGAQYQTLFAYFAALTGVTVYADRDLS